jgi:hypothetical protein
MCTVHSVDIWFLPILYNHSFITFLEVKFFICTALCQDEAKAEKKSLFINLNQAFAQMFLVAAMKGSPSD